MPLPPNPPQSQDRVWDFSHLDPVTVRQASPADLEALCKQLRKFLIEHGQTYGGHFASGLGVIELAVALFHLYEFPKDRVLWDTGHQAYPHKVLSGRGGQLHTIRKFGGLAPFPCLDESAYDPGPAGHAGNALSLALGLAQADLAAGRPNQTIAVVGDGALESGLTLEALNHLSTRPWNVLLILNLNGYSISPVPEGSLSSALLRSLGSIEGSPSLSALDLPFRYVKQGGCLCKVLQALRELKGLAGPKLLVIETQKGHGYGPAEQNPVRFHAYANPAKPAASSSQTFQSLFGAWASGRAERDARLHVVTPAMLEGSGLSSFARRYPKQFTDVGIAEAHAITFSAGLQLGGLRPIPVIYSSFLQRAYDSLLHDVALPKLPVLIAIDRAGICGEDGASHQGLYDLGFLKTIPGLWVGTPSQASVFHQLLDWAYDHPVAPMAIRYPKRSAMPSDDPRFEDFVQSPQLLEPWPGVALGRWYRPKSRKRPKTAEWLFLNFGALLPSVLEAAHHLGADVLDLPFASPIPTKTLALLRPHYRFWVCAEEGRLTGGVGESLACWLGEERHETSPRLCQVGVQAAFVPHGSQSELIRACGLDGPGILRQLSNWAGPPSPP